jgi:hypothetical protein
MPAEATGRGVLGQERDVVKLSAQITLDDTHLKRHLRGLKFFVQVGSGFELGNERDDCCRFGEDVLGVLRWRISREGD